MRTLLAAAAACLLLTGAASAEGLLDRFPAYTPPPEQPATSGFAGFATGAYVGLTGGYSTASIGADSFEFGGDGLLGGVYGGFNYRFPGAVLGIEGDWMLTDIKAEQDNALLTFTAKTNQLSSIRARAGVPLGPVLLYGTGGIAFTQTEVEVPDGSDNKLLMGWVMGAGVEVELTRTMQVRLEGLHYTFDDEHFSAGATGGNVGLDQTIVRAGIGFRLN